MIDYPDKVGCLKDGWAVRFNGSVESARWRERVGAQLHLQLLQQGYRKPQPEVIG